MTGMNKNSRTSLFLMELILSVLLFALTSAVCARLFVQTHQREKQAKDLQFVMAESQTVTALLRANSAHKISDLLAEISKSGKYQLTPEENTMVAFYDETYAVCSSTEAFYRMTLSLTEENGLLQAQIRFDALTNGSDDTPIRSFTIALYQNRPFARADKEAR